MSKWIVAVSLAGILAGCASMPREAPVTHVVLEHATLEKISAAFTLACSELGGRIVNQTANMLECAKPMGNSFKENLYKAAATERYASNPDFHFQWTFYQTEAGIAANSNEWIEHQNGFGRTTRDDIQGGDAGGVLVQLRNAWVASPAYQQASR